MKQKYITLAILALSNAPIAWAKTETPQVLDTISVHAKSAKALSDATNSHLRDRVNLGLLGRQNAFSSPITAVNYDEKIFADKSSRHVVDTIAQTDASVMAFGGESNTLQGLYVRGLQLDARQFSLNGLAGLYSAYSSPTANVGAAQLIKGASSATVGMDPEGAVGAAVNIETKKAADAGNHAVSLSWIADSRAEIGMDFGERFGAQKQWGVRFNGKFREGDTPRSGFSENAKEAAINLDYRGTDFQAALDASYAQRATQGGRARVHDIQLYGFELPEAPDGRTNLSPSWQAQTTKDQSIAFTFNWRAQDWLAISGGVGHMESEYDGNFAQIKIDNNKGVYTFRNAIANNTGTNFTPRGSRPFHYNSRTTSANLKARAYAQTGNVSHQISSSLDYVQRSRDHDQAPVNKDHYGINKLDLYHPVFPAAPDLNRDELVQGANNRYTAPSWAISDTLGLMDDTLRLTLGGRFQWIEQENMSSGSTLNANRFSPMALVAYVPSPDLTIYSNYLEDLEPGSADENGHMSDPRVSRQFELGVRKNWGNMVTTASLYQITRPTFWRAAGTYQNTKHYAGQTQGKERNRGLELNVYANLFEKTLRPYLGLSYIKADLIDSPTYTGQLTTGTQVASPRIIAKAGVEWDTPFVQGLTLNANAQYYGKSYQDTQKQYAFPAYTLVDLGAKYVWKIKDKQYLTMRAGIENLFNKNYWQVQRGQQDRSFALVGLPRTVWLKGEYSF